MLWEGKRCQHMFKSHSASCFTAFVLATKILEGISFNSVLDFKKLMT